MTKHILSFSHVISSGMPRAHPVLLHLGNAASGGSVIYALGLTGVMDSTKVSYTHYV